MKHEASQAVAVFRNRAIRDGVIITVLAGIVFLVSSRFDVFDWLVSWVTEHESLQLDEIFTVSMFLVVAGFIFVLRRRNEIIGQIQMRERAESEKAALIPALEKALKEVQTLSDLLPVCAWCKRIRDDQGYWSQVDAYLQKHTSIGVTHGICPDCAREMHEHGV
jgi:hypothetical protein